ncbi:MAG: tetratricopeptide repeat protein [Pseudohongiellaceae bacterium]
MDAGGEQIEAAWANAVRALQLSPGMSHLWVNWALSPDALSGGGIGLCRHWLWTYDRSAMNNLMVLYGVQGREKERAEWELRVTKYRDRNPYYHAWLGDQAAEEQDWRDALAHYREAMSLAPADPGLMFSTGLIFRQLGELKAALRYIDEARRHATLVSEKQAYTVEYEQISRRLLAGQ